MATAVLIVILLTVAASLASWLFSQWLARRARISGAALAVAGGGTVFLIGAVALILVAASTGWVHFIPVEDFSMLEPAPVPVRSIETVSEAVEKSIAGGVAERVVVVLEAVEVEQREQV